MKTRRIEAFGNELAVYVRGALYAIAEDKQLARTTDNLIITDSAVGVEVEVWFKKGQRRVTFRYDKEELTLYDKNSYEGKDDMVDMNDADSYINDVNAYITSMYIAKMG